MLTRLDPATPAGVRAQIVKLTGAIDDLCTILHGIPIGDPEEADVSAAIDVIYKDADAILREWERDVEVEPRPFACCGPLCAEFQNECAGGWACTDQRRADLRK